MTGYLSNRWVLAGESGLALVGIVLVILTGNALLRDLGASALGISVILFSVGVVDQRHQNALAATFRAKAALASHQKELAEYAKWVELRNASGETDWPASDLTPLFIEHFPKVAQQLEHWWRQERLKVTNPGLYASTHSRTHPATPSWTFALKKMVLGQVVGSCQRCLEIESGSGSQTGRLSPES